eukprot:gb/GFBE01021625.1/.p1 GENE.gb/GFBE01021625.1/~~gb/GFBE01021625.1/.p1  ORF type:complete len:673 (+),score=140.98 gb/GFBE01021625.1/:1-2019(+)
MADRRSMPEYVASLAANITDTLTLAEQEHLLTGWDETADYVDGLDQSVLSLAALLVGVCLVAKGADLMKFLVVALMSMALGARTWMVARKESHGASGGVSALIVIACAVVFTHRVYTLMVFVFGALLGGIVTFAGRETLGLDGSPAALLAFTMLVSVFTGLTFKHYRIMGWRVLTPAMGGLLLAASVRFWVACMFEAGPQSWLGFAKDEGVGILEDPCEVFFAVSWGVCTLLGWHCQLAQFFGGEDPFALPPSVAHRFQQLQFVVPFLFDADDTSGKTGSRMLQTAGEPLMAGELSNDDETPQATDYRPEAVVILAVSSVLVLNMFLMGRPLLFLGHVVLMSSAFLPFMTAGLMAYASPNRLLPGLAGPSQNGPLLRHFTHATFNILAFFCAVGGYLCMYGSHLMTHESQVGLSAGTTWNRTLHAWVGYVIMGMLFLMTFSGAAKMLAGLTGASFKSVASHHAILGRVMYGLAMFNQVIAYFFRDLFPLWGSLLLTAMLLCVVVTTMHFLRAHSSKEAAQQQSAFRPALHAARCSEDHCGSDASLCVDLEKAITLEDRGISAATTRLESLRSIVRTSTTRSSTTASVTSLLGGAGLLNESHAAHKHFDWEVVMDAFDRHDKQALLKSHFVDWHRATQAAQITRTNAALQGSDNLVSFLSEVMVGETRTTTTR